MTAKLTCDRCGQKGDLKAYLPKEVITLFPTTYWMLDNLQTWYSVPGVDICPQCFQIYKEKIQDVERKPEGCGAYLIGGAQVSD